MNTLWPSADELEGLTDHQREQYAIATRTPVGILGGGPGCGKTHTTAAIIKSTIAKFGAHQIAIGCATGKAAQRVNELLQQYSIEGISSTTIHRMLGVQRSGRDGKGWAFMYGESLALPARFVFIDEASMLSTNLAASLLAALRPGSHLLFIGDFAQLPPVDHGAPLRDMIAAGLPYGELTQPMRNGGDVVRVCQEIKEGKPYRPSPAINLEDGSTNNLGHFETQTAQMSLAVLRNLLTHPPAGIDPVWDIQVICPINEKSEVSRKALNGMIQEILNHSGATFEGARFRMDDKVICGSNSTLPIVECPQCNYGPEYAEWLGKVYHCTQCDATWPVTAMAPDFVANGEMGRVTHLEKGLLHVTFDAPARTVRVAGNCIDDFDLAYACTAHKSQGSQWPVIVCVVDESHGAGRVCSWEWWRTAISRLQRLCVTIGKLHVINRHCKTSALKHRKTFLRERLTGEIVS